MDNKFSEKESFDYINQMLATARRDLAKGTDKQFLLWGYLIVIATIAHFCLLNYYQTASQWILWISVMGVGVVVSIIMGWRQSKQRRVKSYTTKITSAVWGGFILSIIVAMVLLSGKGGIYIYPTITLLYTFSLFISAVAYGFRWMYVSVALCALGVIAYIFVPLAFQPLIMTFAMVCGNIVPGHIIGNKIKQENRV